MQQPIEDAVMEVEGHIKELAAQTPHVAFMWLLPRPPRARRARPAPAPAGHHVPHPPLRPHAALLEVARGTQSVRISMWITGVALFELAVTDLKEADTADNTGMDRKEAGLDKKEWAHVLVGADAKLDRVLGISGKS
ncbi:hypothetical protein C8R44DRAFT_888693 [Mycena epipterygia]|nr:hypothetical protein C8R44DRAFT_888693 [Mycena epipterygia]